MSEISDQLQDFLGLGDKTMYGVDIGHQTLKACFVQRQKNFHYKVTAQHEVSLPEGILIEDEIINDEEFRNNLNQFLSSLKKTKNLNLGLFGPNTVAKRLQLAGGSLDEIEDQVYWEADQYLPFPVDDCLIGFDKLGDNAGGGVEVLVVAAKKGLINKFKEIFESHNYKVKNIELKTTALINVYEIYHHHYLKDIIQPVMILDIGSQSTTMLIMKNKVPLFVKEIATGGQQFTEEIVRELSISFREAEDLKCVNQGQMIPQEVLEIIERMNQSLVQEIKKSYDFYAQTINDEGVVKILTTGGGSLTSNFADLLGQVFKAEVLPLDITPFINFDSKISSEVQENFSKFNLISFGLALREVER